MTQAQKRCCWKRVALRKLRYLCARRCEPNWHTPAKRVVMFRPSVVSRTSRNAGNDELGQNDTSVQVDRKHTFGTAGVASVSISEKRLHRIADNTPEMTALVCKHPRKTPKMPILRQKKRLFLRFYEIRARDRTHTDPKIAKKDSFA